MGTPKSNVKKCQAYKTANTRIINRKAKLNKHLADNPNDSDALKALKVLL